MSRPLPPGSTIGVLGGGQLGRMLAVAAARLGFDVHVFAPEPDCPAGRVAAGATTADYLDFATLDAFAGGCAAITYEFENIPLATAERLEARGARLRPGAKSLALTQDRLTEKRMIAAAGLATAPFAPADSAQDVAAAAARLGPSILKTRRYGYDGKGQARLRGAEDAAAAWDAIGAAPAILEGMVRFAREVSVIGARGADGAWAAYDVVENIHEGGVLRRSLAPASVPPAAAAAAIDAARRIAEALDHVGVLGVEFFAMADGGLIVNEIAPRVHNSGHWTEAACAVSQFEQHIRAVAGWPLADPARHADADMRNLIGEDAEAWADIAADPHAHLTLYGKRQGRDGRKMGHVTHLRRLGSLGGAW